MARSYYSTVFDQSADEIWRVNRDDFNNYPVWVDGAGESTIEDDKACDAVGAVRNVLYQAVAAGRGCSRSLTSSARRLTPSKASADALGKFDAHPRHAGD